MRKVQVAIGVDSLTFTLQYAIFIHDGGENIRIGTMDIPNAKSLTDSQKSDKIESYSIYINKYYGKYNEQDCELLYMINKSLKDNGHAVLNDEESEAYLEQKLKERTQAPDPTSDELQRLSGFKVEKVVTLI